MRPDRRPCARSGWAARFKLRRGTIRDACRLVLSLVLAATVWTHPASQTVHDDTHPRSPSAVTLLQINDVYSTLPVDGMGGLARVGALKQDIATSGRTPLLLIAGDFLSSSVASTVFKGAQMVEALNAIGLDVATLGNHEFDFGIDVLRQRMREARWQWVVSNVIDRETRLPIGGAAPYLVRTFGTLRVGIIGLCLTTEGMPKDRLTGIDLIEPLDAAAAYLPVLRQQNVDVIVALTHLTYAEDRALAERFPEIDVIVGGHEHVPIASVVGRTLISKAGTEARHVARIDLNRRSETGPVERFYELLPITTANREDPAAAAVINDWEARLGTELLRPIGRTSVPLNGLSPVLRSQETNLGNLVADAARADVDAEIAIINSGGLRGDRMYAAGTLTRRTLLEIHPFGNVACKVRVPGRLVLQALEHGVSKLPVVAGHFPQVSGITFRVNPTAPAGQRIADVQVSGAPLDPARSYTLAIPDYLLNGGDGYTMFDGVTALVSPDTGRLLVTALETYVTARGAIAPAVEGRITIGR